MGNLDMPDYLQPKVECHQTGKGEMQPGGWKKNAGLKKGKKMVIKNHIPHTQ